MLFYSFVGFLLFGGCWNNDYCPTASDYPFPNGEYDIVQSFYETTVGGSASITEDTVTFVYTDQNGQQWEVVYDIVEKTY